MDVLHKVLNWLDHNRYLAVTILLTAALSVWLVGCQPMTGSVLKPGEKVTAVELEREAVVVQADVEAKLKQLELAQADIQRQVELRTQAIQILGGLAETATTGTFTPATGINAVVTLLGLIGLGAVADNRRKDKVINGK